MKFDKPLVILLLVFSMIFAILLYYKNDTITIKVYHIKKGFGYSLYQRGNILIKQNHIPVLQERRHFCSYNDAYKIAAIVKNKIKKGENPRITLNELKENNISFLCN